MILSYGDPWAGVEIQLGLVLHDPSCSIQSFIYSITSDLFRVLVQIVRHFVIPLDCNFPQILTACWEKCNCSALVDSSRQKAVRFGCGPEAGVQGRRN